MFQDPESGAYFRAVVGYAAGATPCLQSSCPHLVDQLTEALGPACRRVYPGAQVARWGSAPGTCTWHLYLAPVPDTCTWHLPLAPVYLNGWK